MTPEQAHAALDDFIAHRLPDFGRWQDAMGAAALPVAFAAVRCAQPRLLDPRTVLAAIRRRLRIRPRAARRRRGFIRQILGWREFVRGVCFRQMPALADSNQHDHATPLPAWFWTGPPRPAAWPPPSARPWNGYAHHDPARLMVTGNFALLAGLAPRQVADWYLAVYVDAVAWVEEPNTLGMALNAWPGMTSKPCCASGAYIDRMSDYCHGCRYKPSCASAPAPALHHAVLGFWLAHRQRFAANPAWPCR